MTGFLYLLVTLAQDFIESMVGVKKMEKQYKQIDDAITGQVERVELTAEEYAELEQRQKDATEAEAMQAEAQAKAEADKATAQAKLEALGLTVDDLAALGL
jgi:pyridoxine 5'-phosphate synthase PdxJ